MFFIWLQNGIFADEVVAVNVPQRKGMKTSKITIFAVVLRQGLSKHCAVSQSIYLHVHVSVLDNQF